MNGRELLIGLGHISTRYYAEAETDTIISGDEKPRHRPLRRPLLMAAIIAMMLLLAGCAVAYVLSVKDLHMGQVTRTRYELDENRQPVSQTEVVLDVISAQGVMGSPNFLASREWLEFEESYEPDPAEAEQFVIPAGYEVYHAFSQEMVDKVDELCEKYGLKPMGTWAHMQSYQFGVLYEALGFDSLFHGGVEMGSGVGYFTECGNFNVMFSFTLTSGEADWKQPIGATLHYADKAYFDTIAFSVDDAETVKQRTYTRKDGTTVLLVGEGSGTILLYDREDAFISLYFDTYSPGGEKLELSDRDIGLVAEAVDFTVRPQKPDMAEVDRLLAEAEQAHQEELAAMGGEPETYGEVLETLADWDCYYVLADLNGDGTEELLVENRDAGYDNLYVMLHGRAMPLMSSPYAPGFYLCENGIIEIWHAEEDGSFVHDYKRLEKDIEKDGVTELSYVRYNAEDDSWHSRPVYNFLYDEKTGCWVPEENTDDLLTEEEAKAIVARYPRVELERKPVSTFSKIEPISEPVSPYRETGSFACRFDNHFTSPGFWILHGDPMMEL